MNAERRSTLVILGATSAISQAYTALAANAYQRLILVARSDSKLEQLASHFRVTCQVEVDTVSSNLADCSQHATLFRRLAEMSADLAEVLVCYGELSDQQKSNEDPDYALEQFVTNGSSAVSLWAHAAQALKQRGGGTLIAVSSVAGDRGRRSNFCYGAAKSALSTYLAGLSMEMADSNVHVLNVKPGFVDTPMTAEFKKGALWATPDRVAKDILNASRKQKTVIYTPWFWRYIMLVIKLIPTPLMRYLPI